MTNFEKVKEFMEKFGQTVRTNPEFPHSDVVKLRVDLIQEELDELREAIDENNIVGVADALTDILYVTYGAGLAFGINLDKVFDEVHSSNMSKLGEDGKPIYNEKGKVMKSTNYRPPDIKSILSM